MSTIDISENPLDDGFLPSQGWFRDRILAHITGLALDCGCGRGLWSKKLREKGIDVVGLDLSLRRLKISDSAGNCDTLVRASCSCLPFRSNIFDSALLVEVIEHLPRDSQDLVLQELSRVLKVEGCLTMTTPNKPVYLLLTKAGFFEHNPEHIGELSYRQARSLFKQHFHLIDSSGKTGVRILDYFLPMMFRWNLLFVGRRVNDQENFLCHS